MKLNTTFFCLLAVACIIIQNSGCQQQAHIESDNLPAKIEFDSTVLDFGNVGPGTKNTREFTFKNTGTGVLEISNVSSCCGVVTSLEKKTYFPGESGTLKVTFNSSTVIGGVSRQFYVSSNDKTNPAVTLDIKANIVQKVAFTPTRFELKLDKENADCPQLTLKSLDNQPFSILGIQSPFNSITCEIDPSVKATEYVLDLKADIDKIQDIPKGTLEITFDHPESKFVSIPFTVLSYYTANPVLLVEFNVEPEKPKARKVWIYNNYKEDFEIESVTSEQNHIKVINQSKIFTGYGYQFEIEITPPPKENQIKFSDVFNINIKGGQTISIPCTGYYLTSAKTENGNT